jgi:hypothetical protein
MAEPVVYDKAKYHYDGDYPKDLPIEQAFVHTGMFFGWLIDHDLYDNDFVRESGAEDEIRAFKNREMSGAKLYEHFDGALVDEMLSTEGNAFAQKYFDFEKGSYLKDYGECLAKGLPTMYHVQDTWENYDKIKQRIDQRYQAWKKRQRKKPWEFWK